jgi:hypothetical protein
MRQPLDRAVIGGPLPDMERRPVRWPYCGRMGIFGKRKPALTYALPEPWPTAPNLGLGEGVDVVGESYYREAFDAILFLGHDIELKTVAVLLPEPHNEYDSNAVAVHVDGHKVGHLSRTDAVKFRTIIDQAVDAYGSAVVWALVERYGGGSVILEPQSMGLRDPMTRRAIQDAIDAAAEDDEELVTDLGMERRTKGWRLWCSGGLDDDDAKALAKALRGRGYAARAQADPEFAGYYVSVTGHSPKE